MPQMMPGPVPKMSSHDSRWSGAVVLGWGNTRVGSAAVGAT